MERTMKAYTMPWTAGCWRFGDIWLRYQQASQGQDWLNIQKVRDRNNPGVCDGRLQKVLISGKEQISVSV